MRDAPLTLDGVRGRAHSIRRRRHAVGAGVVAAALLAVAIPVGLSLGGQTDSSPGPATPSRSEIVDTENPQPVQSPIDLPYLEGTLLTLPDGTEAESRPRLAAARSISAGRCSATRSSFSDSTPTPATSSSTGSTATWRSSSRSRSTEHRAQPRRIRDRLLDRRRLRDRVVGRPDEPRSDQQVPPCGFLAALTAAWAPTTAWSTSTTGGHRSL